MCLEGPLSRLLQLEKGLGLDDCSVGWFELKVPTEGNCSLFPDASSFVSDG